MRNITNNKIDKLVQLALQYNFREDEVIKEIVKYNANERYYLSNYGNCFSLCGKVWRKMDCSTDKDGYKYIKISYNNGKYIRKPVYIHRMVAELFITNDNPKEKKIVHHIDGNCSNNNYLNLEYISIAEHNKLHAELKKKQKMKMKQQNNNV